MSGSEPLETFGNAITWRMSGSPAMQRDEPVDAHREAAVRRRAHPERVEEEAELLLLLLLAEAHDAEDRLLDLGVVDPDRARAELPAVPDQVVVLADHAARVGSDLLLVARHRRR